MKTYLFIFFLFLIFNESHSIETKIIHKIQNEIITNIDIKNEFKYLLALNNKLKNLDKFLSINGNLHYSLNLNKNKINYNKIKNYKFITRKKCDSDYLTHYNHYKDYWSF